MSAESEEFCKILQSKHQNMILASSFFSMLRQLLSY